MTVILPSLSTVWYSSQLGTVLFTFLTFLSKLSQSYRLAYLCTVVSLVISLYQSLTASASKEAKDAKDMGGSKADAKESKQATNETPLSPKDQAFKFVNSLKPLIQPAKSHPTTPYIILSFFHLFILPKLRISLFPFFVFAVFHIINYTKTFILPKLPLESSLKSKLKSYLEHFNSQYNQKGFKYAVYVEIFCLLYVTLVALINLPLNFFGYGNGTTILNFLSVFVWLRFISMMQSQNLLMKEAINDWIVFIDGVTADPRMPDAMREYWVQAKHAVKNKDLNRTK